jgi:DNA integrity scanning protein DisA with diadenylate cyclase activity
MANEDLMMEAAAKIAAAIGAKAIVSYTKRCDCETEIPVIWVRELQIDVVQDLTMPDILEISERHMLDTAIQLYLERRLEKGMVVGVFPYAILLYDIEEGKNFIRIREFEDIVPSEVMFSVLSLAMQIAVEGREGRAIGTAFIIGDGETLLRHSHQAILNPYEGQHRAVCDVKNRENWESIKELAQLDGVFMVNTEGFILASGRYLDASARDVVLPGGLGGRHRATAAITREHPVVGVTISESGGTIRVFREGQIRISLRPYERRYPVGNG